MIGSHRTKIGDPPAAPRLAAWCSTAGPAEQQLYRQIVELRRDLDDLFSSLLYFSFVCDDYLLKGLLDLLPEENPNCRWRAGNRIYPKHNKPEPRDTNYLPYLMEGLRSLPDWKISAEDLVKVVGHTRGEIARKYKKYTADEGQQAKRLLCNVLDVIAGEY